MIDSSSAPGGGSIFEYLTPIQDPQEPVLDLKKLALNMLRQAILDIPNAKYRSQTLRWVNDDHPDSKGWITSFETVCWLLDRDVRRTRELLNQLAASGLRMERVREGGCQPPPRKALKKKRRQ